MSHYAHGHAESVARAHARRTVANSAAHLAPHLRPGLSLLDLGSAGGALTRDLALRVAPGPVIGLDLAPNAVATAQADPSRPSNLSFQVGDIYALPFEAGSFDIVHLHQVLHHLERPAAALRQAARVARPGGLVAVRETDFGAAFWFPPSTAWEAWRESYQLVARAGGTEFDAGRRLLNWLAEAGLPATTAPQTQAAPAPPQARLGAGSGADGAVHREPEVLISGSLWTYPGFAPAAEIAASWADRISQGHFPALAAEHAVATKTDLIATAKGLIEWARHPAAFFAMPHIEALIRL
ncbi:MAG: class I SAM-dependent methyltransferase [Bifidobacteriaceae bacterium]|jgi:ubiquinone/menaquinone biosynthesis C-methylase UbiE|nr:class I SAM-dependent methyltransferase [Bifidobacteriaceae bacterium]